jgi:hypothetical protein
MYCALGKGCVSDCVWGDDKRFTTKFEFSIDDRPRQPSEHLSAAHVVQAACCLRPFPSAEPFRSRLYSLQPLSPFGLTTVVAGRGQCGPPPPQESSKLRWEVRHEI